MSVSAPGFVKEEEEKDHRACWDLDKMQPLLRASRPELPCFRLQLHMDSFFP